MLDSQGFSTPGSAPSAPAAPAPRHRWVGARAAGRRPATPPPNALHGCIGCSRVCAGAMQPI